jgi:hypothetical protein
MSDKHNNSTMAVGNDNPKRLKKALIIMAVFEAIAITAFAIYKLAG